MNQSSVSSVPRRMLLAPAPIPPAAVADLRVRIRSMVSYNLAWQALTEDLFAAGMRALAEAVQAAEYRHYHADVSRRRYLSHVAAPAVAQEFRRLIPGVRLFKYWEK